jgi:hypothetical protein
VSGPFAAILSRLDVGKSNTAGHQQLHVCKHWRKIEDMDQKHTPSMIPYGKRASNGTGMLKLTDSPL